MIVDGWDIAKEAMGKDRDDKLLKGIGASDVKKTLNHIVKHNNCRRWCLNTV